MAIGDDFTIDYTNKRIYHSAGTTIYSVNALYSYLQNTFDELDQMDDPIPMSAQTPTEYTLINGWFMNEAREGSPSRNCFEFLKGGAIQTSGQLNEIQVLKLDGVTTDPIASDIGKQVKDDTAEIGPLLDYDIDPDGTDTGKWWIRTGSGTAIVDNSVMEITGSTAYGVANGASVDGENLWPNIYTLGSIEEDLTESEEQQIYIEQAGSRIFSGSEWWPEGAGSATTRHIDVLIKVKEAGTEVDGAKITVFLRHYQTQPDANNPADLYDHFGIDLTAGGRNAVPLATSNDINNTSYQSTVSGYSDITIAFVNGTITYSAISGSFNDFETVTGSTSGATGLFLKQTTTTGAGTMTLGNVVGDFQNGETLTGGTSGKTATSSSTLTHAYTMTKAFEQGSDYNYSVIIDCATRPLAQVYEYFKYVTRIGSTFTMYPTTYPQGGPGTHSTKQGQLYIRAHEDNQTTPTNTFSPVKASPFGTFAGGKFFGAQGIWIENMASADVQNYQLIDSGGTTRTPPNKQSITISNLLSGDRVSVFVTSAGTTINKAMYSLGSGNNTNNTTLVVTGNIFENTPSSGAVRIVDTSDTTNDREKRHTYTSWSGSTFTGLSPALDRAYTQTDDKAYVPFIDTTATGTNVSVQVIYKPTGEGGQGDKSILVRVRRYTATAILPFETTGTFGSTGYSTAAIRTVDSIVS